MRTQLVGELPVVAGEECYMHVVYFLKTPKLFNYKLVSIYNGDFLHVLGLLCFYLCSGKIVMCAAGGPGFDPR